MLQINPNEIIRINKLINDSLETVRDNVTYLQKKYENNNNMNELEIEKINKTIDKLSNSTTFLDNMINEIVEATGESIDKLLTSKHSLSFFENKLIAYYANKINNNEYLENIDLCYSKDGRLTNYCQKQSFIEYASEFFKTFNAQKFGLDKDTVINDLLYIYDKRGANEAYAVMRALENNCPDNYHEYNFNPTSQIHSNDYYDYNSKTINNYQTNSEIINVNGYQYEIAQVLPQDCTKTEMLAYNFGKANIINTMRTLPNKYLELCSKGNTNAIILTSSRGAMNNNANWSGYYKPTALFDSKTNMIAIDIRGSFNDNTFYTQDTIIHEMGHKFDDMIYNKNFIDKLFGNIMYSSSNSEWKKAYKQYNYVLTGINLGGYNSYPNVSEFMADSMVAYYKDPTTLNSLCPEVYSLINTILGGEYGYSYNDKMVHILSGI